jgi:hypothetical protein
MAEAFLMRDHDDPRFASLLRTWRNGSAARVREVRKRRYFQPKRVRLWLKSQRARGRAAKARRYA